MHLVSILGLFAVIDIIGTNSETIQSTSPSSVKKEAENGTNEAENGTNEAKNKANQLIHIDMTSYDYNSYMNDQCTSNDPTSKTRRLQQYDSDDYYYYGDDDDDDDPIYTSDTEDVPNSGGEVTDGNDYEKKYGKYFNEYYNGEDADSGYDHNNESPNKQREVTCNCINKATKNQTQSMSNTIFNKCVNEQYGNNAYTWDHPYLEKYNNHNKNSDSDQTTLQNDQTTSENENMVDDNNDSGSMEINDATIPKISSSNKIRHNEYMSYIAAFLFFIGSLLLFILGMQCIKFIWKSYRLRNYETIGNDKKISTNGIKQGLKKIKKIRLPKHNKKTKFEKMRMNYTDANEMDNNNNDGNDNKNDNDSNVEVYIL